MNKLSVIIICQNEENRIRKCLESVAWADEIIIVDSGSEDNTLEIARAFTDKIFIHTDWKGFGAQKRFAESKASYDWVFSIDADEIVSKKLRHSLQKALKTDNEKTVYRVNRLTRFCGRLIRHSGWHPDWIVRLYNRKHYHFNNELVHEQVHCPGATTVDLDGYLYHDTLQSLEDYIDKRNRYAKAWARNQHAKNRHVGLFSILTRPAFAFMKHYFFKRGFLDGYQGFLISVIQAHYTFNKYNFLKMLNDRASRNSKDTALPE